MTDDGGSGGGSSDGGGWSGGSFESGSTPDASSPPSEPISVDANSSYPWEPSEALRREDEVSAERSGDYDRLADRLNEPDVYTPTVDLTEGGRVGDRELFQKQLLGSGPKRPPVFPGPPSVRRELRSDRLGLTLSVDPVAEEELRQEVRRFEREGRPLVPVWAWGGLAALAVLVIAALLGAWR